jgi:predicted Zn-dependent peptidase
MEAQTGNDKLYDKLSAELDDFVDDLRTKPIDEILVAAYEKAWKEEILMSFESSFYSDDECAALLAEDNALDTLYREWLDTDVDYLDSLRDCIDGIMTQESERGEIIEEAEEVADYVPQDHEATPASPAVLEHNNPLEESIAADMDDIAALKPASLLTNAIG